MRHYYFDVKDGIYVRDDDGRKFRNDQDALQHARNLANELCRNRRGKTDIELVIRDEYHSILFRVCGSG